MQTSPDESNLKLDVILASLSINVILLCQYLRCENVFVVSPCCGGCHILAGSRMPPATRQVTVVMAAVSVTGVN
jgi:hypothetical protein